ncbi:hypothetical protein PUN28_009816 [Cardiocondyla obscurior]|uniref:Uncharacterized protein n=1 Tax=Cardiocondyla obscurior TaxID=286306 RepID=A0AAW2FPX3_9HYME
MARKLHKANIKYSECISQSRNCCKLFFKSKLETNNISNPILEELHLEAFIPQLLLYSPLCPPPFSFVPEEAEFLDEDDSVSLSELDFQDPSNSLDPSIKLLEDHEESSEIKDLLLKLFRRTSTP